MAPTDARDRATVVDIGKCKLDLPWNAYYEKELDLRFSRSYGPGRYDERYEVEGRRLPGGYVRWTERRNLACFIDLLAKGDIDLEPLMSGVFPVTEAVDVYERLRTNALTGSPSCSSTRLRRRSTPRPVDAAGSPRLRSNGPATVGNGRTGVGGRPARDGRPVRTRLRRRRKLRVVDAAAPPGRTRTSATGPSGDQALALGGERAAEVRLRVDVHRPSKPCCDDDNLTPCSSSPGTAPMRTWYAAL